VAGSTAYAGEYSLRNAFFVSNFMGALQVYCLFDSDYHTPGEIQARYKQAHSRGVELHIWKKKEIENYLLVPGVIQRLIADSTRQDANAVTECEIEDEIDRIVESQEDIIFDALSAEFHVQNRAGGIAGANKQARKVMDNAWKRQDSRWSLAPGKTAISELSRWSQQRYHVSLSPLKILKTMKRGEIDHEVIAVVTAIERGLKFEEVFA
jgi:hypothetical protein